MVREEGFEPPRACARQVLSLLRLPVPPFPQSLAGKVYHGEESLRHPVPAGVWSNRYNGEAAFSASLPHRFAI
jgi:hypothetical protein